MKKEKLLIIIKELQEQYPSLSNKNDVVYKLGLNYVTFEPEFIFDPLTRKLIKEMGQSVIIIIHFFRCKMCTDGWKVRVDDFYGNDLFEECAFKFYLSFDDVTKYTIFYLKIISSIRFLIIHVLMVYG
ncbi:MAG: hypothetical protein K0R21_1152 [Anaerocolumna sp.]|nr:hypothetical protein [Anaerocolumna sp.]